MKKINLTYSVGLLLLISFGFNSCSSNVTSIDNRYKKEKDSEPKNQIQHSEIKLNENFDFSDYRNDLIDISNGKKIEFQKNPNFWYGYEDESNSKQRIKTTGYRVEIFSCDTFEEADSLRTELYFTSKQKSLYIVFEPPIFRVRAGNFVDYNSALEQSYKFIQLGFPYAKIVQDSIYIYQ